MTSKKREEKLKRVFCIWYPGILKNQNQTKALLNSKSEVNAMNLAFTSQLDPRIWKINVGTQKIDGTTLETYGIVIFIFFLLDKDDRETFFKESFLLADVKPDIIFGMLFLTISNADVDFQAWNLQ